MDGCEIRYNARAIIRLVDNQDLLTTLNEVREVIATKTGADVILSGVERSPDTSVNAIAYWVLKFPE